MLVEREAASVQAACRRVLRDPTDAEDAAQDAFVLAFRKLGSYRGDGPLGGWLMRIALREARDRAIRRQPTAPLTTDDFLSSAAGLESTDAGNGDPATLVMAGERDARVRAAVDALPGHYREAVRLRYLLERSFPDIAAETGRPEPTVRSDVRRGLRLLHAQLGEEVLR